MRFIVLLAYIAVISYLPTCTTFANDSGDTDSREGDMFPGRFTDRARTIFNHANEEATKLNHGNLDTEHLLLGVVLEGQGIAARALLDLGVDLERLGMEVRRMAAES